jgi:integrase
VVQKVRALEARRDSGLAVGNGKLMTLGAWLSYWVENIAGMRVRPRTLESYQSVIRLHLLRHLGPHRLQQLRPEHLDAAYGALLAEGLSAASVLRMHRLLHRAMHVAQQRDLVTRNVVSLVDPPRQMRPHTPVPLSTIEVRDILRAAAGRRNAARWSVALALGLRQSEALALQWKDIDLAAGSLSVRRTLHRVAGVGLVFDEPKSDRSRRTIALPKPLRDALGQHRDDQRAEEMLAGTEWRANDLVFAQPNGKPIDSSADYKDWCDLLADAGLRHVRLHDARHTAATLLLAEGVHPRVVMDLLGHSQMRTTMDTYSHVMPALAKEAAESMAEILW